MMFKIVLVATLCALATAVPRHTTRRAPRLDGRIVGGQDANIEDYPYQVSMRYFGSHMCGGSIVDETHVVTAAHCTDGMSASYLSVSVGSSNVNGGKSVQVSEIRQNPDYESWTTNNDISILVLAEPLELGAGVQPIELVDSEPAAGADATCTGWGALREGGSSPTQLQSVVVNIVDRKECEEKYSGYLISKQMICAGVNGGGKDACQGDSGGPLAVGGKLAGVVSWGLGCARPQYPGIYSNVAALRDFVDNNLA